jgi:hypothetical protein
MTGVWSKDSDGEGRSVGRGCAGSESLLGMLGSERNGRGAAR